jgi:hypothetical protein
VRVPVRKRARLRAAAALAGIGLLILAGGLGRHFLPLPDFRDSAKVSVAPPAVSPADAQETREPARRIAPRTVRPPKEATPRKEEPGRMRRWWDSAKRKLIDKSGSAPRLAPAE